MRTLFVLTFFVCSVYASAQTRYPTILEVTPATSTFPCVSVAATDKTYAICPQNNAITVDFGDGKGYVSLAGTQGPAGPAGPTGPQGPQGPPGNLPATFTCDFTLASGGKATLSNCK